MHSLKQLGEAWQGGLGIGGAGADYVFTQGLGAELLANPDFNWSAGSLTSWTVQNNGSSSVTEVAAGGGAGTGAARLLLTSGGGVYPRVSQVIASLVAGDLLHMEADVSAFTSGQVDFYSVASNWGFTLNLTASGLYRGIGVAPQTGGSAFLYGISTALDMVVNSLSLKKITPNAVLTVTANTDNRLYFTLPASPLRGDAICLHCRRVDNNDYLELRLVRNAANTNWDLRLHRVVGGVQTNNIITAVTSVGNVNGIRLHCSGNTVTAHTTDNSGGSWTSRGSSTDAANHPTGTGLLPIYTSAFSPQRLEVIPL
jgi:hypothetical protein